MGKFVGHVLPGSYLLVIALWWCFNVFRDFFRSIGYSMQTEDENGHPPFRSRMWYPGSVCQRFPLEIAAKIVLPVTIMLTELIDCVRDLKVHNLHHFVIMMGFILDGSIGLMVHYKWPLPKHSDSASNIIMFLIDILVFASHQNGKTVNEQSMHTYLIWTLAALALLGALQTLYLSNAILPLIRAAMLLLFSTWLIQLGFITEPLFSRDVFYLKDKTEADQLMVIGFLFTCHCLLNIVFVVLFGLFVFYVTKPVQKHTNVLVTTSKIFADDDTERLLSLQPEYDSKRNGLVQA